MKKIKFLIVILTFTLSFLFFDNVYATTIDLTVREQYGVVRTNSHVTIGIPLPEGSGVVSVNNIEIIDSSNIEVDSQLKVLERWNGLTGDTTKEIKWVLADFKVNVPANDKKIYKMRYGNDVSHTINTSPILVNSTQSEVIVNTGVGTFKIDRNNFNLFKSVVVDGNEFIETSDNVVKIVDSYGENYFANNNTREVVVEEQGVEKVVVRASGWHQNDTGTDTSFYGFTTRMYFYRGKSIVKIDHTLENVPENPRGALAFKEYSFNMDLNLDSSDKAYMIYGNTKITGILGTLDNYAKIYQGSNGTDYWNATSPSTAFELNNYTQFRGYKIFKNTAELENNNYALGVFDITDSTKGVTVAINKFWQKFPKAIQASKEGELIVGLIPSEFSNEGNYNHYVEDMAKLNTEIFINFHIGAYNNEDEAEIMNMIHPVIPTANPSHYAECAAVALPPGSIFADASPMTPYVPGVGYTTLDSMTYPLIDSLDINSTKREIEGFYSAYSYGPYISTDNAQIWKPPVHSDQFMRFMRVGVPGNSSTKHQFKITDHMSVNPMINDNTLFFGGVDFVKHLIYLRAGNSPSGQVFSDLNIENRTAQKSYYFSSNYPVFGGRVGIDNAHTLSTLVPRSVQSGHLAQPTRRWFMPEGMHIYIGGVVDYYHLTGDIAAYDWIKSFSENFVLNFLTWDIHQHGEFTGFYNDGYGNLNQEVNTGAMRSYALPIANLMMAYKVTGNENTLNYAKEMAKIFDVYQDKDRGFYITDDDMSAGQYDRLMWGLISLYNVTGDEKYFDIMEGYSNGLYYYTMNPDSNYLDTYNSFDENGNAMSYSEGVSYFDSSHHQQTSYTGYDRYKACSSSNRRILYIHEWMSKLTGESKYRATTDYCYDTVTNNAPSWQTDSAELNMYLYNRYNNPKTDTIPPSDILILTAVNQGGGSWKLDWTAPSGMPVKYQIKYSEKPMVDQIIYPDQKDTHVNYWATDNVSEEPVPGVGSETMIVTGLDATKNYIFAIRSYDASNNRSEITLSSDVITMRTDVDQNSSINTTDAMLTLRNSLGLDMTETAWQVSVTTGDVNCDGSSNSVDAVLLLRYSLGLDMSGTDWCE